MTRTLGLALAAVLGLAPSIAMADGKTSLEELVTRLANTPEEHQAVADYFRGRAADERAEGEAHKRMGRSYAGVKASSAAQMKSHCERLAEAQATMAAEYEALAKLHEAEAKVPQAAKP